MPNFTKRLAVSVWLLLVLACHPLRGSAQDDPSELTLREAEQLLQSRNRDLQLARRSMQAARANTLTAGARPNPNLSLGVASINPQVGVGAGGWRDKTVDTSVRVDQLIERGDKRELRLANAGKLESASAEDYSEVFRQQRLALRSAYYDLLLVQDKTAVTQENAALFQRSLDAAELRLKAGDIAAADVARLRVDALRAQNDLRAAEADRRRAQLALAYLIGMDAEAQRIHAADPWPAAEDPGELAVTDEIVDRRPDVRAARARVDAATQARDLARSLLTRDVSV